MVVSPAEGGGLARGGGDLRGGAVGDADAVPGVDEGEGGGEVGDFLFGEEGGEVGPDVVGDAVVGDAGDGFGVGEGGAFARGEEGGFAPDDEELEAFLGDGEFAGVGDVHLEAEGAAVDLGGADFDELEELVFEAAGGDDFAEGEEGGVGLGGELGKGEAFAAGLGIVGHGDLLLTGAV